MTQINNLPTEVLAHLFGFIPSVDFPAVASSCRVFQDALEIESLWKLKCQRDYDVKVSVGGDVSCRAIYTKLLHKYGKILGLWKSIESPYGGVYFIMFNPSDNTIYGQEFKAPKGFRVQEKLRKKLMFTVKIQPEGYAAPMCHRGYEGPHACEATLRDNKLWYRCSWRENHEHPDGPPAAFAAWLEEHSDAGDDPGLANHINLVRFITDQRNDQSAEAVKLVIPRAPPDGIIQPGLFKGTYGAHGIEIVLLHYSEDGETLFCTKITGDPNIPTEKVSMDVDLRRPMVLSLEQQMTMDLLKQIDIPDVSPDIEVAKMPSQPFRVPHNAYDRSAEHPKICQARFHSRGQVAGPNYNNPSFIAGHFMHFDENTFGHLWLELNSFSLFSRVIEDFSISQS